MPEELLIAGRYDTIYKMRMFREPDVLPKEHQYVLPEIKGNQRAN